MKEFTVKKQQIETATALGSILPIHTPRSLSENREPTAEKRGLAIFVPDFR